MIDRDHPVLSIVRQCELVSINRSGLYHEPAGETALNLALMRLIDAQFMETPWYGSRQMTRHLRREGHGVGRKRIRLEQNDEWAVQRARYMTLETIAGLSDDPVIGLPEMVI